MFAAVDIGNTRIKAAVFRRNQLANKLNIAKEDWLALKQFLADHNVKESIICSSGGMEAMLPLLFENVKYIKLSHKTAIPVENRYATPETLGRDRIAAVVGANALYPMKTNLVFDIGTCMTIDLVDENGIFIGGNISPGINLRLLSMHHFTANLPLIDKRFNEPIGFDTETAIQNGACWGLIFEINGVISHFSDHFQNLNVILTGGDAQKVAEMIDFQVVVEPDLILLGLKSIYEFND